MSNEASKVRRAIEQAMANNINYNKDNYNYDRTYTGKIIKINADNTYNVLINTKEYKNILPRSGFVYKTNDIVTLTSPQNNMNKMFIAGGVQTQIPDIDLSGYVTIETNQTITGQKTFSTDIILGNNKSLFGKNTSNANANLIKINNYNDVIIGAQGNTFINTNTFLAPITTDVANLGSVTRKWKSGYFSGDVFVDGSIYLP